MSGSKPSFPETDRFALGLVALFAVLAVAAGIRTGYRQLDVDEVVFRNTLLSMREGTGYYRAMRDALVEKDGLPPTQVRSIRPPTLYLALHRFPPRTWRLLVGVPVTAALLLSWRLGRTRPDAAAVTSVVLTGIWLLAATPLLFLHAELWGIPLLLGGLLAARRARLGWAALLLVLAAAVRETYVVALVVTLIVMRPKRPWVAALIVVAVLGAIHAQLAQGVLAETGYEPPLGQTGGLTWRYVLETLSPSGTPFGWIVGIVTMVVGVTGAVSSYRGDAAGRIVLLMAAILVPTTLTLGRAYWALTYGVAVASFAPQGLRKLLSAASKT